MRSSINKPAPRRPILEHDPWLTRLAIKYGTPRAVLARQLAPRGALEHEIGLLIVEVATQAAHALISGNRPPPDGTDAFDRAVRGVYTRIQAAQEAAEEAERQRRYAESDTEFLRIRAEQQAGPS